MKNSRLWRMGRLMMLSGSLLMSTGCDDDDVADSVLETVWLALRITDIWV